jgi:hypothetical protein
MAAGLAHLEVEVEAARRKLAGDLAALRSPHGIGDLGSTLKDAASELRDEVEDRAMSVVSRLVENMKAKAAANPAALLAIGAGLLWHFARRPPITAALLGVGVFSLIRTPAPARADRPNEGFLQEAGNNLLRQTGETLDAAGEVGLDAMDDGLSRATAFAADIGERGGRVAASAAEAFRSGANSARDATQDVSEKVVEATHAGVAAAGDAIGGLAARSMKAARSLVGNGADDDAAADQRRPIRLLDHGQANGGSWPDSAWSAEDSFDEDADAFSEADEELVQERSSIPVDTLLLGGAGLAVAATVALVFWRSGGAKQEEPASAPSRRKPVKKGPSTRRSRRSVAVTAN